MRTSDFFSLTLNPTPPELDGIALLVPKPASTLAGWLNRWNGWRARLEAEKISASVAAATPGLLPTTQKRLQKLVRAFDEQDRAVTQILAPLGMQHKPVTPLDEILGGRLPFNLSLTGYETNLYRDWCWGTAENELSLEHLDAIGMEDPGVTLVLGSGWGRLAYDIHQHFKPSHLVATDLNPLCLFITKQLFNGRTLHLNEFLLAPTSLDKTVVLRELKAPKPIKGGVSLGLMDVTAPMLKEASFDTVVTPWLIDVIPEDFRVFAQRVNALLKPDGKWIEFGSLAFSRANLATNYSKEEVLEILEEAGFEVEAQQDEEVPYLDNPDSRHSRREKTWLFRAVKKRPCPMPAPRNTHPDWVNNPTKPIPKRTEILTALATSTLFAELLSLVDEKRTIADLAAHLTQKYHLETTRAVEAVTQYFATLVEQADFRSPV